MAKKIETPDGTYTIYHTDEAGALSLHEANRWYYEPVDYAAGDVYSPGYATEAEATAAARQWAASEAGNA